MTLRACLLLRVWVCVLAVTLHASATHAAASRSILQTCADDVEGMKAELAANSTATLAVMIGNATFECNTTIQSNDTVVSLCSKNASEPSIGLYCANTCGLCTQSPTRAPTRAPTQASTDTPIVLTPGANTECAPDYTLVYTLAETPGVILAELSRLLSPGQCAQACAPNVALQIIEPEVGIGACGEEGYADISRIQVVKSMTITLRVAIFDCTTCVTASPTVQSATVAPSAQSAAVATSAQSAAAAASTIEASKSAPRVFWSIVGLMWMVGYVAFLLASLL